MENNYIAISYPQLALGTLFIIINVCLSLTLQLRLTKSLVIASLRMIVQLLLVGYALQWVFTLRNPLLVLLVAVAMTSVAALSSVNLTRRRFSSIYWNNFVCLLSASFLVTGL